MANNPINRRVFFRHGLSELMKPLGKAMRPLEEMAKQFNLLEKQPPPPKPVETRRPENTISYTPPSSPDDVEEDLEYFLRPPGSRDEQEFLNVCSRCGNCVHACPVQAIQLD